MSEPLTFSEVAAIRERTQSLTLHAFLCRDIPAAGSLVEGAVDAARDILRLLDEVSMLNNRLHEVARVVATVDALRGDDVEERSNNPFDRRPDPADVAALRKAVRDAG